MSVECSMKTRALVGGFEPGLSRANCMEQVDERLAHARSARAASEGLRRRACSGFKNFNCH
eukprot:4233124-Alexandrium_andersonii.AAC.1